MGDAGIHLPLQLRCCHQLRDEWLALGFLTPTSHPEQGKQRANVHSLPRPGAAVTGQLFHETSLGESQDWESRGSNPVTTTSRQVAFTSY